MDTYQVGFSHGCVGEYQRGHKDGYIMAMNEMNLVFYSQVQRIARLERMLRVAHHDSSQKSDVNVSILAKIERQREADSRVATDRLDQLVCARAEILDLKEEYESDKLETTVKAEWLVHDLQAARRVSNQLEVICRQANMKATQLQDRCDSLDAEVKDMNKKYEKSFGEGKNEFQNYIHELRANLDYAEKELEEVNARNEVEKSRYQCEIDNLHGEAKKHKEHLCIVEASQERFQQVFFATTARCDELSMKVCDAEKIICNQASALEEARAKTMKMSDNRDTAEHSNGQQEVEDRQEFEELDRQEFEELDRQEAEELDRQEAEECARQEAEECARQEAEECARQEAEECSRQEAEERARQEAEERARQKFGQRL